MYTAVVYLGHFHLLASPPQVVTQSSPEPPTLPDHQSELTKLSETSSRSSSRGEAALIFLQQRDLTGPRSSVACIHRTHRVPELQSDSSSHESPEGDSGVLQRSQGVHLRSMREGTWDHR